MGLRTSILGNGRPQGIGVVPFERALVNSCRPSIVTFALSLILYSFQRIATFVLQQATFPSPHIVSPNISPCSPGSRWMVFGLRRAKNLCGPDPSTLQTDRQTDRETTCNRKTALCTIVHRAVKTDSLTSTHYYLPCSAFLHLNSSDCDPYGQIGPGDTHSLVLIVFTVHTVLKPQGPGDPSYIAIPSPKSSYFNRCFHKDDGQIVVVAILSVVCQSNLLHEKKKNNINVVFILQSSWFICSQLLLQHQIVQGRT